MNHVRELLETATQLLAHGWYVLNVASATLGVILLWSGLAKAFNPRAAARALLELKLARGVSPVTGAMVAAIELILGAAWLTTLARSEVALASGVLFALYAFAITRSLRAGLLAHCGCFGFGEAPLSRVSLVRACVLSLASFALVSATAKPDVQSEADGLLAVVTGIALVFSVALIDVALHTRLHPLRDSDYIEVLT